MIGFALKTCLIIAVAVVGSVLLVNNVPFLKANILEVVNPRVQEGKLVEQLKTNLTELGASAASTAGTAAKKQLLEESRQLLEQIDGINQEHSGIVAGIVGTVTDALLGSSPSATPTPQAVLSATPAVVTVTVTVTPSPCN